MRRKEFRDIEDTVKLDTLLQLFNAGVGGCFVKIAKFAGVEDPRSAIGLLGSVFLLKYLLVDNYKRFHHGDN